MNKMKLHYSVCNYIPSPIRKESIIFGIVIHCPEIEVSSFYRTSNLRRLRSFDDEYDKEFIDMMTETFHYYFDSGKLDEDDYEEDRFELLNDDNFIPSITRFYVNEFQFSPQQTLLTSNSSIVEDIEDLKRTYLYYDRPKSERIMPDEVKRLLSKRYKNFNLNDEIKKPELTDFADNVFFDFEYSNTLIKAMSFDYLSKKDLANQVKIFRNDILDNKEELGDKDIKIVIGNTYNADDDWIKTVIDKLTIENLTIEVVVLGEYLNTIMIEGLQKV